MRRTHKVAFNLDGLLRGDIESRCRAYAIGWQWGWLSANDVRDPRREACLIQARRDYCLVSSRQDAIRPVGETWRWQSSIRFGASIVPNV